MDAVAARLQREVARRPYLAADVESLLSRPWVAAVVERTAPAVPACLVVARPSPTAAAAPVCMPCAAAGRVLDEVDKCLADAGRVHKLVDCLGYASRHQSTYAVLDYLEAAFVQDELRGAALAEALAPLLRVEGLAPLDGHVSAAQLGCAIDRLPAPAQFLDAPLRELEARLELHGGRGVDIALRALALAVRLQLPQKALLVAVLLGARGDAAAAPKLTVQPALLVGALALAPLPLVAWAVDAAMRKPLWGQASGGWQQQQQQQQRRSVLQLWLSRLRRVLAACPFAAGPS